MEELGKMLTQQDRKGSTLSVFMRLFMTKDDACPASSRLPYGTVALEVALCAMRSATISYASCAMCYACALRRFPMRSATISYALCDDFLCVAARVV